MKKIIVLMALALGLFACDDGKKNNGGGGNAGLNLGNIKIGETITKTFVVKNVLGVPALTTLIIEEPPENLVPNLIRYDPTDCEPYATAPNRAEYDLPVGVTCNMQYTIKPELFAKYTLTMGNVSASKSNVENIKTELETIDFIASIDGLTEPNPDIEYKISPFDGFSSESKQIEVNKTINTQDYILFAYGQFQFLRVLPTQDDTSCNNKDGCFRVAPTSVCEAAFATDRNNISLKVPPAGCKLVLGFYGQTSKPLEYASGFYLRPGTDLTVPLAPNQPVQRYVFKREF